MGRNGLAAERGIRRLSAEEVRRAKVLAIIAGLTLLPGLTTGLFPGEVEGAAPLPVCATAASLVEGRLACEASGRGLGGPDRWLAGVPVDLNCDGPESLVLLPGIGPKLAEEIVEHRRTRGPFLTMASLEEVRGIGPKLRARIEARAALGRCVETP